MVQNRKRLRHVNIFPDYSAKEIVIGEIHHNITNVMAVIPYIDKRGMIYAVVIQKALQRFIRSGR